MVQVLLENFFFLFNFLSWETSVLSVLTDPRPVHTEANWASQDGLSCVYDFLWEGLQ